jgi:hypothetical protein
VTYTAKNAGWYGLLIVDPAFRSPFVEATITPWRNHPVARTVKPAA